MMAREPRPDDLVAKMIDEIARQHGVVLSRRDPILMLQTMSECLLRQSCESQEKQLASFKEELAGLSKHWHLDAREMAERLLNASLVASQDAIRQIMETGAKTTVATVRAEMATAMAELELRTQSVRHLALLNIVASFLAFLGAAIALWAALGSPLDLLGWSS